MVLGFDKLYELRDEKAAKETIKSEEEQTSENIERSFLEKHDYNLEAFQVYKAHQEAIKKSECLQCEILKGVNTNEDITTLFLKACETISLITGTKEFNTQIKRKIES